MEGSGARCVLWPAATGRRCGAGAGRAATWRTKARGQRVGVNVTQSRKTAQAQTGPSIATKNGSKRRRRGGQGRAGQGRAREAAQSKKKKKRNAQAGPTGSQCEQTCQSAEEEMGRNRMEDASALRIEHWAGSWAERTPGCWSPCRRPAPHQPSRSRQAGSRGGGAGPGSKWIRQAASRGLGGGMTTTARKLSLLKALVGAVLCSSITEKSHVRDPTLRRTMV